MAITTNVPSNNFDDWRRDGQDLTKFVNQDSGTVTTRTGDVLTPLPVRDQQFQDALSAIGYDQAGTFSAGFTYTAPNQVGQDIDGNWWRWNGTFPKVVTAGTLPSSDADYKLVGDGVLRSDLAAGTADVGGSTSLKVGINAESSIDAAEYFFAPTTASGAIAAALAAAGGSVVKVGRQFIGENITGIVIPSNGKLDLQHAPLTTTSDAVMFQLGTSSQIHNANLSGSGKASGLTNQILIKQPAGIVRTKVTNSQLRDAGGKGFNSNNSVTSVFAGGTLVGVDAFDCNIGLDFGERGEYFIATGGLVNGCNQGVIKTAGNVVLDAYTITNNTEGFRLAAGDNDAHGTVSNCMINHNTTNVYIEQVNSENHTFMGCHIYAGIVHLNQCTGVWFTGGSWGVVTVYEEGCVNCGTDGVRFNDQYTSFPNHNSLPSEFLFYNQIFDRSTNLATAPEWIQGVYCFARKTGSNGTIATGASAVHIFNTVEKATAKNPTYTAQTIYDSTTGEMSFKAMNIRGGRYVEVDIAITLGRTDSTDLNPDLLIVRLRDKDTGAFTHQFSAGVQESGGTARVRCYQLSAKLFKDNYEIVITNNTGVTITSYIDNPSNVTNRQLSRALISESR